MDELQSANKCFTCKTAGHMSKDCPNNNSLKRTKLGAVYLTELEKVSDLSRKLSAKSVIVDEGAGEQRLMQEAIRTIVENRLHDQLQSKDWYPGDQFHDAAMGDRWAIRLARNRQNFFVIDRYAGHDTFAVPYEAMLDESFDASDSLFFTRAHRFVECSLNNDAVE